MANMPMQGHLPLSWTSVCAPMCLLTPSDSPSTKMMEHQSFARQELKAGFRFTKALVPITVCKNICGCPLSNCFREPSPWGCGAVTIWMREKHEWDFKLLIWNTWQKYTSKLQLRDVNPPAPLKGSHVSLAVERPLSLTISLCMHKETHAYATRLNKSRVLNWGLRY